MQIHRLSVETFKSIQWFCLWTAKALIRLSRCAGRSGHLLSTNARRHIFAWCGPFNFLMKALLKLHGSRTLFPAYFLVYYCLTCWVKISADSILKYFYFFTEIGFDISCKLFHLREICMSAIFWEKKEKNIINLSFAEFALRLQSNIFFKLTLTTLWASSADDTVTVLFFSENKLWYFISP